MVKDNHMDFDILATKFWRIEPLSLKELEFLYKEFKEGMKAEVIQDGDLEDIIAHAQDALRLELAIAKRKRQTPVKINTHNPK
jgi:hypothetical protein